MNLNKNFLCSFLVILSLFSVFIIDIEYVRAESSFIVPQQLRGRVDFWKGIFAKYGKHQKVVHHRRFPQVSFKVLDFSKAAQELSPSAFQSLVKKVEKEKVDEIYNLMERMSKGGQPQNSTESFIVQQMDLLPGGVSKYQQIVEKPELIRTQTGIREKAKEAVERSGRYIKVMESIFASEANLPVELTRLPFIESSFNYTAYSSVGAAGMWQFMPATAKKYMTVGSVIDERLDPFIATRAAAKYLRHAYNSLGAWGLAVTSYNHGVAGVKKKTKEAGTTNIVQLIERTSGEPVFGFASQNFWPEFLAAVEIMAEPKKYYPDLQMAAPIRSSEYRVPRPMFLNHAASLHGVTVDALLSVNYALLSPVASGKRPIPTGYILRIPAEGSRVAPIVTPTIEVQKNKISKNSSSKKVKSEPANTKAKSSKNKQVKSSKSRIITVKSGQTLSSISKIYGVRIDEIKRLNNLKNSSIKTGQKLKLS
jgi:membrane-bound lytic murein transglycosylase D